MIDRRGIRDRQYASRQKTTGSELTPKGPPGRANGFPTAHDVFIVPVDEFPKSFKGLHYETAKPLGNNLPDHPTRCEPPAMRPHCLRSSILVCVILLTAANARAVTPEGIGVWYVPSKQSLAGMRSEAELRNEGKGCEAHAIVASGLPGHFAIW